ncbi:MAG: type II toxin-antitoxin system ParD family antitoxin [Gimesia sp.]|nr:type II toxin-antitoxin system ParD family antitoxin [Gimesia sp.]
MASMNISLPEPMRDWVKSQIDGGRYANHSDYVRDLIRRDQVRAEKLKVLQDAITQGLASGEPRDFDVDRFKQRMTESREG